MKKTFFLILVAFCALNVTNVFAQEEEIEIIGRPDCFYEDADGTTQPLRAKKVSLHQKDAPMKATGNPIIPVLLVEFSNRGFTYKSSAEEIKNAFDLFFNGTRDGKPYTAHGSTSSIRDYFITQSGGVFAPEFDILDVQKLPNTRAYYGASTASANDVRRTQLQSDCLAKLSTLISSNKNRYDSNGDGTVDMAFILFAGGGENVSGNPSECIWPFENSTPKTSGGITYACSAFCPELYKDDTPTTMVGTGVFLHEFCHALGLPDMYDTKYVATGMDIWSLMDYGENVGNGRRPTNLNAYELDYLGWNKLEVLNDDAYLELSSLFRGGKAYKMLNPSNVNEYYILEYRDAVESDQYLLGTWLAGSHGLIVYHIDESESAWSSNSVNTSVNHQRITIIPANNLFTYLGKFTVLQDWKDERKAQLFPGTLGVTELTDTSTPSAKVFTGTGMKQPLTEIALDEINRCVTLKYKEPLPLDVELPIANDEVVDAYTLTGIHLGKIKKSQLQLRRSGSIYIIRHADGRTEKLM